VARAVDLIFQHTQLRRIVACVHEGNLASRRLLERLGFKLEGLLYLVEGRRRSAGQRGAV
jgi:RimJ/RimL family protein N-acetyltransferase